MNHLVIGTSIFILTYIAIASEKIHKMVAALIGAGIMLLLKVIEQSEAFEEIDFNVIFLLAGMMIIVNITKRTGIFQWIAIKSAKLARGEPFLIIVMFALATAVLSAFLDNVTTILLMAPVTLLIADELRIDPVPYMIVEALASNIGGSATLIGDPPNIMIGSAANLGFISFLHNLAPVVLVIFISFIGTIWLFFMKDLKVSPQLKERVMELDERRTITDKPLLIKCSIAICGVMVGFALHEAFGLQPATIALSGAGFLFLISGVEPDEILRDVEWTTLFFFIGLFIVVGGIVKVGLVKLLSERVLTFTHGNQSLAAMLILWLSAFASAVIDNIPFVATMIPLIKGMAGQVDIGPLWWALALGACLGGNGTIIGASANVIASGISERSGHPISFIRFMMYGMPLMVESIIISSVYIYLRYLH